MIRLGDIAYARSGDKGAGANIGVIARRQSDYALLKRVLTSDAVARFFEDLRSADLHPAKVTRYELPNLWALNFVLSNILDGGGSVSLRLDAQGKTLGQALLEMTLDVPEGSHG
jgi:hypothetical protein